MVDIDGVETEVLMQHYRRLGGSREPLAGSPTSKSPKQLCSIYPSLEEFLKPEGKDFDEKPHSESPGSVIKQNNQVKN